MKKLLTIAVALLIAASQVLISPAAYARPAYPFGDTVGANETRHHIIPWEQLTKICDDNLKTRKDVDPFLANYKEFNKATQLTYKNKNQLAKEYIAKTKEALDDMASLCAWMQGDLVKGPDNRPNDPGSTYDTVANQCRIKKSSNQQEKSRYTKLEKDWKQGTAKTKWDTVRLVLINYKMADAIGDICWK